MKATTLIAQELEIHSTVRKTTSNTAVKDLHGGRSLVAEELATSTLHTAKRAVKKVLRKTA